MGCRALLRDLLCCLVYVWLRDIAPSGRLQSKRAASSRHQGRKSSAEAEARQSKGSLYCVGTTAWSTQCSPVSLEVPATRWTSVPSTMRLYANLPSTHPPGLLRALDAATAARLTSLPQVHLAWCAWGSHGGAEGVADLGLQRSVSRSVAHLLMLRRWRRGRLPNAPTSIYFRGDSNSLPLRATKATKVARGVRRQP